MGLFFDIQVLPAAGHGRHSEENREEGYLQGKPYKLLAITHSCGLTLKRMRMRMLIDEFLTSVPWLLCRFSETRSRDLRTLNRAITDLKV